MSSCKQQARGWPSHMVRRCSFQELLDEGLLEIGDGYRAKNSELGTGGPMFLRAGHVTDTHISFENVECFLPSLSDIVRPKMAKAGDTVVTTKGNSTGRTAFVSDAMPPFVYSPHLSYWRSLDHNVIAPEFLRYWAKGSEFAVQLAGMKASTDMAPYLSLTDQRRLRISVPPIDCQRAIGEVLGSLDDKIELNRRTNQTLEALAAAIFKAWFIDFEPVKAKAAGAKSFPSMPQPVFDALPSSLVLAPNSPSGEIPSGWEMRTFGNLADLNVQTLGKSDQLQVIDYIEISEVNRGEVGTVARYSRGEEPSRARRRLRHGDSVVSTVRPDRGSHFLCLNPAESLVASTGFAVLSSRSGCWAHLYAGLTQPEVGEELGRLADGGAYPAVRPEVVAGLSLPHPNDHAVVQAFQDIAEPLFLLAHQHRQENRTLAALRDSLLPKLLSGEVRVGDIEVVDPSGVSA